VRLLVTLLALRGSPRLTVAWRCGMFERQTPHGPRRTAIAGCGLLVNVHRVAAASPAPPSDADGAPIRVFIVASVRLYREGLAAVLDQQCGIDVGVAGDVRAFFDDPPCGGADVTLLDMTVAGSLAAVRRVSSLGDVPRVVAVAVPDDDDYQVIACAEAGVHGYVTRDEPLNDLLHAVESAARGEAPCSARVSRALLKRVRSVAQQPDARSSSDARRLTARELEIVALIAQGLSNKEIATRLTIERATVKNHVHNILGKLGVDDRAAAVHRVWNAGFGLAEV
jgi:two-component system nitrate/nitrite response regulator NarL